MSDTRARLAGKTRRRTTVSVVVTDTTEAVAAAAEAQRAWFMREGSTSPGDEEANRLEQVWIEAKARVAACYTDVEFQACSPLDFEVLQRNFTGKDGELDPGALDEHLPALVAACAVEEDLRDEEFWREQFTGGSWSYGEKVALGNRLLNLNLSAPDERIPFG